MKKYKIEFGNKEFYILLEKFLNKGFVFTDLRLKTVKTVEEKKYYGLSDRGYILVGYYGDCSIQLTACSFFWSHKDDYQTISLDDFFKLWET